ncbi:MULTISPECIES: beta-ketoacyl synthase N-terminal-like domain-containing protein [Streptomyces]|uniref:beta-ketoacyl synthase N-terminal-like domain-containing protein n=1 Tax=Streptomyces TaxID=1883 RepID=UPI000F554F04|nr:beta-ketoacyl synthase N-terminal-like domain-containing protein [Streptomyces sp. ADI98-12]NEE32742.1 polyketide beta-ketoacyl:ACP synthase [Streptomyces sp. SID7982]RPK88340.1 Polyketide biosynthesis malonyl-ACP decarboxylase PksF [Streptomyces sp. ADI98-12]
MTPVPGTAVVITGTGVRTSVAEDTESFRTALREGRCGTARCSRTGPGEPAAGAELAAFDLAAALERRSGLSSGLRHSALRAARRAPLGIQVAVVTALEAWESAGLGRDGPPADRIGLVVAGSNLTGSYTESLYPKLRAGRSYVPGRAALHLLDTDHVGVLSQVLNITGEGCTVGGASASGNVGIITGSRLLALRAVDVCLVVGALSELSTLERQALFNLGVIAGGGDGENPAVCAPFDEDGGGTVPGQGCGALVLETRESARRRQVPVLAEIAGYGLALDGNALADPDENGEFRVMSAALRMAGLSPEDIDYVNAHGTGTVLGDRTEAAALRRLFGARPDGPWINATKALTGHCLHAAGVVEAVATVVQMTGGFVHANVHLRRPVDAALRFAGRRAEPAHLAHALSNSFGFGGVGTSVLLSARSG